MIRNEKRFNFSIIIYGIIIEAHILCWTKIIVFPTDLFSCPRKTCRFRSTCPSYHLCVTLGRSQSEIHQSVTTIPKSLALKRFVVLNEMSLNCRMVCYDLIHTVTRWSVITLVCLWLFITYHQIPTKLITFPLASALVLLRKCYHANNEMVKLQITYNFFVSYFSHF